MTSYGCSQQSIFPSVTSKHQRRTERQEEKDSVRVRVRVRERDRYKVTVSEIKIGDAYHCKSND